MEKMDKLSSIKDRIKAKTPPFWRKIRKISMALTAVGLALVGVDSQYPEYTSFLPDKIIGIIITIGAVGTALSSLTAAPEPDQSK